MQIKRNGFSLIELIVVITIMMVVTAVGIVSYQGANRSARDGRRKSEIEKIRTALEMYKQENRVYPPTVNNTAPALVSGGYLAAWPTDPQTGKSIQYRWMTNYTYQVWTCLEGSTSGSTYGSCCDLGAPCNYFVSNP